MNNKINLIDIKNANRTWFSTENVRLFGDLHYLVLHDSDNNPFLVRKTNAWSDMLGQPKTAHFRVNHIEDNLKIGDLCSTIFKDIKEVKKWLKE